MTKEELKATIENKKKAIAECIEVCKKYGIEFTKDYEYTDDFNGYNYTLDFVIETENESLMLRNLEREEELKNILTDVSMLNDITLNVGYGVKFTLSEVSAYNICGNNCIKVTSNVKQNGTTLLGVEERTFDVDDVLRILKNK